MVNNNFDFIRLRKDLEDYFTSAMFMASPIAMMDVIDVKTASSEELIKLAKKNKFDLNKYRKKSNTNNSKKRETREEMRIDWFDNPLI